MKLLLTIKKYLFIYGIFIKNCIIASMEYRANFIVGVLSEVGYLFPKCLYISVVYTLDFRVNGLTPDSILLFIGTYSIITGIMSAHIFVNYVKISGYVRDGGLDMLITKPISLQFMVTLRYVDFSVAIPNVVGGLVMVIVAWSRLALPLDFFSIGGYILLMLDGLVVTYGLLMTISLMAFWIVNAGALQDIVVSFWDFNTMPMGIYTKWLKRVGVYIIPIFFVSNFPCLYLLKQLSFSYAVWAVIVPIWMLVLFRIVWKAAIKRYASASS